MTLAGFRTHLRNMLKWDTRDKEKVDLVADAKAILAMGAELATDEWLSTYGPDAAKKAK